MRPGICFLHAQVAAYFFPSPRFFLPSPGGEFPCIWILVGAFFFLLPFSFVLLPPKCCLKIAVPPPRVALLPVSPPLRCTVGRGAIPPPFPFHKSFSVRCITSDKPWFSRSRLSFLGTLVTTSAAHTRFFYTFFLSFPG